MQDHAEAASLLIDGILDSLPERFADEKSDTITTFISRYYRHTPESDFSASTPEDFGGAAISHWQLMQSRKAGETLIRVYNPKVEQHGWQSQHSVIEIVTDDMPYLVNSISMTITQAGYNIHLTIHPILRVERDARGKFIALGDDNSKSKKKTSGQSESLVHLQVDRIIDDERLEALQSKIKKVVFQVSTVHADAAALATKPKEMSELLAEQENLSTESKATLELLQWLDRSHFHVFGAAVYTPPKKNDESDSPYKLVKETAIGLMRGNNEFHGLDPVAVLGEHSSVRSKPKKQHKKAEALPNTETPVTISKANTRSPLNRPEALDVITFYAPTGKRIHTMVGLFTQNMNNRETSYIPLLKDKTQRVLEASGSTVLTHDGKSLLDTMESLPRDLLFQADASEILEIARGIANLQERQRIKLFGSLAAGGRYYNCLVYIPRDNYGREIRTRIQSILLAELHGTSSDFSVRFSSQRTLARLHFVVQLGKIATETPKWENIERRIVQASISWDDRLHDALLSKHEEDEANRLFDVYREGFPSNYKEDYSAQIARSDISFIENQVTDDQPVMSFYRHLLADISTVNFKIFSPRQHIALSDVIPIIENMGLKADAEHPFQIKRKGNTSVWIHEFTAQHIDGQSIDPESSSERMQQAFGKIWAGEVEDDEFNRLMLVCDLDWRQVIVLRSYCKYLLQIKSPFSQAYIFASLVNNAGITRLLVDLFEIRFRPAEDLIDDQAEREEKTQAIEARVEKLLGEVESLDEDRILRAYLNLINSTLRTNHYCTDTDNQPLTYISFKFNSLNILQLPLPRPEFEIFVYSPQVEGIHLRGGKVARGGLRWSDRREDFRTEVLGLMKAQMVKNAVIVPVGSKGGFYVKRPPENGTRDELLAEGIACYKTFLRGLLDLTDNLSGDSVTPPKQVVRFDEDDPYLVVAADKGTATFSDYANEVAEEYGFWLGDAFASGGSDGYDHKKMGITARGAWESVKRHFRELGKDIQNESFTVVGVGDMAGDVFGNGMLLSTHIKLLAAFNHQHIFIDPTPDCASSYAERERMFKLPRSSWQDYDESLLSAGGGIYSRSSKRIDLSQQAMDALDITEPSMTPNQLIHELLKAPVDLLWNGGIGTYMKSSTETHLDAHDRANDAVRVDASEVQAKVIGEGGNLGFTQRSRIEFASHGGRINTDAIDNSAGVDCSDHEVNIKVLVNSVVAAGDLTEKHRNTLLADMTDEVGDLVLIDNYLQTQCISHTLAEAPELLEEHARFITSLEEDGQLNREIEFLPSKDEIAERLAASEGLQSPEIAVLVSYSKMTLYSDLLDSEFPEDPFLFQRLQDYFPARLRELFSEQMASHRLRREIIATVVTNEIVNRLGPTCLHRMQEELGASPRNIGCAFIAVCEFFDMNTLWSEIEALDNQIDASVQTTMHRLVRGLVERATHWILRSRRESQDIEQLISHFKPGIDDLIESIPECLASINRTTLDERCDFFVNAGVPESTAQKVARVVPLSSALDIVQISRSLDTSSDTVAAVYFELGVYLNLQWLRDEIAELNVRTHWHKLAKSELRSDLHYQQRYLSAEILANTQMNVDPSKRIELWASKSETAIKKYNDLVNELRASSSVDFAMLSLAVNEVHKLLSSDRPIAATDSKSAS